VIEVNRVLVGDVRKRLCEVPDASVDCVITSPPYYLMRDYGAAGQLGIESTVEEWAQALRGVLHDLGRVLKPAGSVWLNLGDTYSRHPSSGAERKGLLLGPERLALMLLEDDWIIRNKIVWAKTNPLPSSVSDRLSPTWEVLYFLVRSQHYFFDLDAVRVPHRSQQTGRGNSFAVYPPPEHGAPSWGKDLRGNAGLATLKRRGLAGHPLGKNPGDVWSLPTASYHGAHFATFPPRLVERPLLATCPERVCARCGLAWRRTARLGRLAVRGKLLPACSCERGWRPGLVLDPFLGAGTVAVVAEQHGRDWLGIELNPVFAALTEQRLADAKRSRTNTESEQSAA